MVPVKAKPSMVPVKAKARAPEGDVRGRPTAWRAAPSGQDLVEPEPTGTGATVA
jgi:hypothetical protein